MSRHPLIRTPAHRRYRGFGLRRYLNPSGNGSGHERQAWRISSTIYRNISVLLVDDHNIVRQGLKALLTTEPDITTLAEGKTGREAVGLASKLRPDVVVMDLAMPCSMDGRLPGKSSIRCPQPKSWCCRPMIPKNTSNKPSPPGRPLTLSNKPRLPTW